MLFLLYAYVEYYSCLTVMSNIIREFIGLLVKNHIFLIEFLEYPQLNLNSVNDETLWINILHSFINN